MSRKYANPPLVEAVCEFRFASDTPWDPTIPGLVYEKLREEFPHKDQRVVQETQVIDDPKGLQQEIRVSGRAVFLSGDKNVQIQLGPHLLTVSCFRPYPTWGRFRPSIERAFHALTETTKVEGLQRIGLRYLNRVALPGSIAELTKYFDFTPHLSERLPHNITGFIVGCELPFIEMRDLCRIQLTNAAPETPETTTLLLDLDYFVRKQGAVPPESALTWVDTAHEHVEELFEACITQALRDQFDESK